MQTSKILTVIGVLIVVVGVGLGIGWLATRPTTPPAAPAAAPAALTSLEKPTATPAQTPNPAPAASRPSSRPALPRTDATPVRVIPDAVETAVAEPGAANIITDWEDRLDEILSNDDEDTNKVQQLLTMFRRLPADGQDEVAQHLSNLVEDEDYEPLRPLALDPSLPESVLDTLLADLLNRPNETKLPMFLDIAFTPNHPKAEEARDLLELYLEDDYGPDRNLWQQKLNEWLKENPD